MTNSGRNLRGATEPIEVPLHGIGYAGEVLREAVASARSNVVGSIAVVLVVASLCATVLLTTGRAVGAEQQVLASIDDASTRSIIVRAQPDAGVDTDVLSDLAHIDAVTWAGGFSAATDVRNEAIPGGTPIPLRRVWTTDPRHLGLPEGQTAADAVRASPAALDALGMDTGGITSDQGDDHPVVGSLTMTDELTPLEPVALVSSPLPAAAEPVAILVVVVTAAHDVEPVRETLISLLAVTDPTTITVTTSDDLVLVRDAVSGQLRGYSQTLIFGALGLTVVLVAAVQTGVIMLRRKDYGRARALGATRGLVALLVLAQSTLLAGLGAVLGGILAMAALAVTEQPLPGAQFVAAVVVLTLGVGTVAALAPALVAARRDPLTELRMP